MVAPMGSVSCGCAYFNRYLDKGKKMKTQAVINGWSILNTGDGIACKYLQGDIEYEICLSVSEDGEVLVNVYRDGVDKPVMVINLEK